MALSNLIAREIKTYFPSIKPYLADRYANKYTRVVLDELRASIVRTDKSSEREGELAFNADHVRYACGRVGSGSSTWLYHILIANPNTALVIENLKGYPTKFSRVTINPIYKEQIMDELLSTQPIKLTDKGRKELDQKANKFIPVDTESLNSYIEQTKLSINNSSGKLREKLIEYLILAQDIAINTEDGIHKEYWETADTGREYGWYSSLQRMPSIVRHAALGHCHRYDFRAHSFAVLASIAHVANPDLKIASVIDYVKNRSRIRQRIANQVGVSEDTIKQVFTSLGFGAKPVNNPYKAIRKAVYNEENYNRLVNTNEFKFIYEDFELIQKTISDVDHFKGNFTWFLDLQFNERNENNRKKTEGQRLAWIYQNSEAYITRKFIDIVYEQTNMMPLLTVHDGMYYKQPIPNEVLIDAQMILRDEFQYVRIEHESIWPITTDSGFNTRFKDDDDRIAEHEQRIAEEEAAAKGFVSDLIYNSTPQPKQHVKLDPDAIEKESVGLYTGSNHQGKAWTGDERYNADADPFFDDMSKEEKKEYELARNKIMGNPVEDSTPEFIKQLLER